MTPVRLRLLERRAELGLTQQDIVARTGLSQKQVSAIELGKTTRIDFATLAKLADALDVHPKDLIIREPDGGSRASTAGKRGRAARRRTGDADR